MTSLWSVDPLLFPITPRVAFFHGLRVYHQLKMWQNLLNRDIKPLEWGWETKNNLFMSIMENEKSSPKNLLWVICCSCKEFCDKRCAYRKAGIVQLVEMFEMVQECLENSWSNSINKHFKRVTDNSKDNAILDFTVLLCF